MREKSASQENRLGEKYVPRVEKLFEKFQSGEISLREFLINLIEQVIAVMPSKVAGFELPKGPEFDSLISQLDRVRAYIPAFGGSQNFFIILSGTKPLIIEVRGKMKLPAGISARSTLRFARLGASLFSRFPDILKKNIAVIIRGFVVKITESTKEEVIKENLPGIWLHPNAVLIPLRNPEILSAGFFEMAQLNEYVKVKVGGLGEGGSSGVGLPLWEITDGLLSVRALLKEMRLEGKLTGLDEIKKASQESLLNILDSLLTKYGC
jgi:hypothetical protein